MTASTARERDPHYRKIVEGLAGSLDRDLFEECVQDLLRQDFPGLVGVYGGSDGGMDGAIPDGEGEPFVLLATTEKNVIRNLTRSLDRRIEEEDPRRKAVLATSQSLTPQRRKNLNQRAREKGFVLLQIFERRDIASRLYRDSRLTNELLNITGELPALSAVPRTRRPLLDVELVGRTDDLAWLRDTSGDRLLVGEPGSGKTSLLLQLVEDGTALFLGDIERFASAFRDQRPEIVLVDDAHVEPERIDRLRQVRREIHAENDFSIVATSWKGGREEVMDALGGILKEQVHTLELLTRSEIVEVYRQIGLDLPADNSYLADLVTQAANRPGLAVTLGRAWLSGSYEEILTGQAIYRSVVPFLKRVLDRDPEQFLAAFALGGDRGMGLSAVAGFLGEPPGRVRDMAARVGASGILTVRGKDEQGEVVLAVSPPQLRVPLLDKIFFGEFPRPWQALVQHAPSLRSVIDTLLLSSQRKVLVPRGEVQELLKEVGPRADWGTFALLGADEAEWVFHNYPGSITDIASDALRAAPRMAIRFLLQEAEKTSGVPDSDKTKPLKVLREWNEEILARAEEIVERRRLLVDVAMQYLKDGGDSRVALFSSFLALSPRLKSIRTSVDGSSVVLRHQSVPVSILPELLELWRGVRRAIPRLELEIWKELHKLIHRWIHPNQKLNEEKLQPFHEVAREMIRSLVIFAPEQPGLAAALRGNAESVDLDLNLSVDPIFDILYPDTRRNLRTGGDYQQLREEARDAARSLGRLWAQRPMEEVIADILHYQEEARWTSFSTTRVVDFELALAQAVSAPEVWLEALLDKGVGSNLGRLLLMQVVERDRPGWEALLERCLGIKEFSWEAATQVLRLSAPSKSLLSTALSVAEPQLVETACLQGDIPTTTLRRLLAAADPRIAMAAAVGEWLSEPNGVVRAELQKAWRNVILDPAGTDDSDYDQHWLEEILAQDQDLAHDWIQSHVSDEESSLRLSTIESSLFATAARTLDESRRARLIQELPEENLRGSLVQLLVGRSSELFSKLLERTGRMELRVAPLAGGPPDDDWVQLACIALDHGIDPRHVAAESFVPVAGHILSEEYWSRWLEAFRGLEHGSHAGLEKVARHGMEIAERKIEKERAEQRRFELTGRY